LIEIIKIQNFKRFLITGINGSGDSYLTEHILTDYFVNLLSSINLKKVVI